MAQIKLLTGNTIDSQICKFFELDNNFYNSILNNYLWFSDPTGFNDPYDFNIHINIARYSRENLIEFFTEEVEIRLKNGDTIVRDFDIDKKVNEILEDPDQYQNSIEIYYLNNVVPNYGVCCFSQNENNLLMWSHYTNKHTGLCLKFDIDKDENFFNVPLKVNYPDSYPEFDYIKQRKIKDEWTSQVLLATKSQDWKYENEIRIIKNKYQHREYRGKIKFSKESLIEVIFGYKMKKSKMEELKVLFLGTGYKCEFSKIELKKNDFGLNKTKM